jgi:hypothetical protein
MSEVTHRSLLKATRRAFATTQLAWLRSGRQETDFAEQLERLLSDEGVAQFDVARRERSYTSEEEPLVARQLAYLAAQGVLAEGRPLLADWLRAPLPVGSESELPHQLVGLLLREGGKTRGYALADGLEPSARRWVEIRMRAAAVQRAKLKAFSIARAPAAPPPSAAPASAPAPELPQPPSPVAQATLWLEATDDAAGEMVRWLTRAAAPSGRASWPVLAAALRATELDGLARPARRFYRLAEGARRLGFERDMGARMRAERAVAQLTPRSVCLALSVPDDVRVAEPCLEYGVLSDLVAAQGIGEALALVLVSPALSEVARWPAGSGVSASLGALFLQLRAEPGYLARVEGHSPDIAERMARHAAIFLLLRTRLSAAQLLVEASAPASEHELLLQLMAATQRALGCELPAGLTSLSFLTSALEGGEFVAADSALRQHAALRERYDEDWFANPRVSEVLRGACARGNLLDGPGFCAELGAEPAAGIARALEILG